MGFNTNSSPPPHCTLLYCTSSFQFRHHPPPHITPYRPSCSASFVPPFVILRHTAQSILVIIVGRSTVLLSPPCLHAVLCCFCRPLLQVLLRYLLSSVVLNPPYLSLQVAPPHYSVCPVYSPSSVVSAALFVCQSSAILPVHHCKSVHLYHVAQSMLPLSTGYSAHCPPPNCLVHAALVGATPVCQFLSPVPIC